MQIFPDVDRQDGGVCIKARTLRDDHPSRLVSVKVLNNMYAKLAADPDETFSMLCENSAV
jgi:hypothetical protein